MLLYTMYLWLRRSRRGRLETERRSACMVLLTILSLILLQSGQVGTAVDAWLQLTEANAAKDRSPAAPLVRAASAAGR
jgi:hypothetical protein